MSYKVEITKQAEKNLAKQQLYIREHFQTWVDTELCENPHTAHEGIVKNAKHEGLQVYKKRFGSFRALFTINDEIVSVVVYDFDSRGQVYKR